MAAKKKRSGKRKTGGPGPLSKVPGTSPKKGKRQPRYDWTAIRIDREGGLSYDDIAAKYGPARSTISDRARREEWRDPADVRRESAELVREENARRYVAQEADAQFANRTEIFSLTARVLARVGVQMEEIEDPKRNNSLLLDAGEEAKQLRRLMLVLNTAELVDARLGGIEDGGGDFRAAGQDRDRATETTVSIISRILKKLGAG